MKKKEMKRMMTSHVACARCKMISVEVTDDSDGQKEKSRTMVRTRNDKLEVQGHVHSSSHFDFSVRAFQCSINVTVKICSLSSLSFRSHLCCPRRQERLPGSLDWALRALFR